MRIADLIKRKNQKVTIRVPAKLVERFGAEAKGTVNRIVKQGGVAMVEVKVTNKKRSLRGVQLFRPQDLTAV